MEFSRAPNLRFWLGLLDLLSANAGIMRHRLSTTREAYESQLPPITWDIFSSQHFSGRACNVQALPVSLFSRPGHIAFRNRLRRSELLSSQLIKRGRKRKHAADIGKVFSELSSKELRKAPEKSWRARRSAWTSSERTQFQD